VARRARLLSLIPEWLQVMKGEIPENIKGDNLKRNHNFFVSWDPSDLELIARFEPDVQRDILIFMSNDWRARNINNTSDLKKYLADFTHSLKQAGWNLDDDSLVPEAGACNSCPKRSSHNPNLFDGDGAREKVSAGDKCTDFNCWNLKAKAYGERKIAEAQEKDPGIIRIRLDRDEPISPGVINRSGFDDVSRNAPGAILAIVAEGNGLGQKQWIRLHTNPRRNNNPKAAKVKKGSGGKLNAEDIKIRQSNHENRRSAFMVREIAGALKKSTPVFINKSSDLVNDALRLALVFGTNEKHPYFNSDGNLWSKYDKLDSAKDKDLALAMWKEIYPVLESRLHFNTGEEATKKLGEAKIVAEFIGLDYKALRLKAEETLPLPKTWGHLVKEGKQKEEASKPEAKKKKFSPPDVTVKRTVPKLKKVKRASKLNAKGK
jgi:hypothetical protein